MAHEYAHPAGIPDDDEDRISLADLSGAVLTYETADGDTERVHFDE